MIQVRDAEVQLTEQTVKELMGAIEKTKDEVEFTTNPISDGDMSMEHFYQEQKKRGIIRVRSEYSNIEYKIILEAGPNETQESLGYKLV